MASYVYINNFTTKGKLAMSSQCFDMIVKDAILRVKGISTSKKMLKKDQSFILNRPIRTNIKKGIVHVWVCVDVTKGTNIQKVIKDITNEINSSILLATEQVPFDVQVKVESII